MNEGFILVLVGIIGLVVGFAIGLAVGVLRAPPSASERPSRRTSSTKAQQVATASPPGTPGVPPTKIPATLNSAEAPALGDAIKRPNMSPVNVLTRAMQAEVQTPHAPPRSIAAQVDEILQEMLKNSPLADRAIRLMELPQKGMVVMIGLNQFDGVEAVPEEDIRQILRAAVAEWERRVSDQGK
jgi:hypothetical protein